MAWGQSRIATSRRSRSPTSQRGENLSTVGTVDPAASTTLEVGQSASSAKQNPLQVRPEGKPLQVRPEGKEEEERAVGKATLLSRAKQLAEKVDRHCEIVENQVKSRAMERKRRAQSQLLDSQRATMHRALSPSADAEDGNMAASS
eukprot:3872758-Amphidinium_carterae.1